MHTDLPTPVLALIIAGAVVAHILLIISARWINPVVLLVAIFFALAPWAAAIIPGGEVLKFARLYLTVLAVAVSVLMMRTYHLNLAGGLLLLMMTFYWLAGIWSEQPWGALQFKGLSMPALLMGLLAAANIRTKEDLQVALRLFIVLSLAFVVPCTVMLLTQGIGLARGGRFAPFGLNANRMAHECACMLIAAAGVALYDKSFSWKVYAYAVGTMAAACILASGSRAAVGQSVVGAVLLGLPMFRRPLLPLTLGGFAAVILWFLMPSGTEGAYERLSDINFQNRGTVWEWALEIFRDHPLWGAGWVFDDSIRQAGSTANLHSIYMQILAETGVAGAVLTLLALTVMAGQYVRLWQYARSVGFDQRYVFLGLAFALAPLAHGLAESSTFMPGTINLVMMAMGFALIRPLHNMATAHAIEAAEQQAADEYAAWEDEALASERARWGDYGPEPRAA